MSFRPSGRIGAWPWSQLHSALEPETMLNKYDASVLFPSLVGGVRMTESVRTVEQLLNGYYGPNFPKLSYRFHFRPAVTHSTAILRTPTDTHVHTLTS